MFMSSRPHHTNIGKRELRQMPTAMRSACGHASRGPSGVRDQSVLSRSRAVSLLGTSNPAVERAISDTEASLGTLRSGTFCKPRACSRTKRLVEYIRRLNGERAMPGSQKVRYAYVGGFTTEKRKARGKGIAVFRIGADGAWAPVE